MQLVLRLWCAALAATVGHYRGTADRVQHSVRAQGMSLAESCCDDAALLAAATAAAAVGCKVLLCAPRATSFVH